MRCIIGGVAVPPGDVAAYRVVVLEVVPVLGPVEGKIPDGGEVAFDAVEPAGVSGNVGQLAVVGLGPVSDALSPRVDKCRL